MKKSDENTVHNGITPQNFKVFKSSNHKWSWINSPNITVRKTGRLKPIFINKLHYLIILVVNNFLWRTLSAPFSSWVLPIYSLININIGQVLLSCLVEWMCSRLLFRRYSVQTAAVPLIILTGFCSFITSFQVNSGIVSWLCQDPFIPDPFQFIIHQLSYHLSYKRGVPYIMPPILLC
jgi:hypothetical protein